VIRASDLPNVITIGRIVMAPAVTILLFVPTFTARLIAWFLFLIAAFSDLWDGYLARKYGWISNFGKLLDPIADKLLLVATFLPILILSRQESPITQMPLLGAMPLWIVLVIFGREALVTAIRSWAAGRGVVIAAGRAGKLKAVFQNIFIGAAIFWFALRTAFFRRGWEHPYWEYWWTFHGTVVLLSLAIAFWLTIWSLYVYLRDWRRSLAH
jgi:CDP-diacylglycerol---glycerol-3-phosphate 3-phosphatidyltransferase